MSSGDVSRVTVVCLTDGRANVALGKSMGDQEFMSPDTPKLSNEELQSGLRHGEVDDRERHVTSRYRYGK